ncbi:MAG: STAS domain-containing protein [Leptospiraceae bacterium]|nr:STAS domain-containing protein [Leptospiraceae bacterium]MCP5503177.1 STAS domain-containing protein [Leptospiraceae bacterium]
MARKDFSTPNFQYEGSEIFISVRTQDLPFNLPDNCVIIDMKGELNLYSTPALKDILDNLLNDDIVYMLFDMSGMAYIDSSGLGTLVGVQSRIVKKGGYLRICSPSESVTNVLNLTKLKQMMRVSNSIEEAVDELGS